MLKIFYDATDLFSVFSAIKKDVLSFFSKIVFATCAYSVACSVAKKRTFCGNLEMERG